MIIQDGDRSPGSLHFENVWWNEYDLLKFERIYQMKKKYEYKHQMIVPCSLWHKYGFAYHLSHYTLAAGG